MLRDTLQVTISDTHSGSNYALFLPTIWRGNKNNSHAPGGVQIKIRKQFEKFAGEVATARKDKRVRLVINGDAIDGDHHNSGDVCTLDERDQADIHIELMQEFQKRIKWMAGDEIYYTRGTQSHVHEMENYIGERMNSVMDGDFYLHDLLKLDTNGVISWYAHHGPGAGSGANEGNTLRNWLKRTVEDAEKDGERPPDVVYTGHVHTPTYNTCVYREKMKFKTIHGIILPSWQAKTIYARMKAPVQKNKIGGVYQAIYADGTIGIPQFSIMGY
jgi:hypothetical protein